MIDADMVAQCADPSLKIEIVQQFIEAAGGRDHLTVTLSQGNRVILVPPPTSEDEAMKLIRDHVGMADVRVGVTQYPAGLGIRDASGVSPDLLDPCKNIEIGSALFAKVYRIVGRWYGKLTRQVFDDAVLAYRTGWFEGRQVFHEADPGNVDPPPAPVSSGERVAPGAAEEMATPDLPPVEEDPNKAGIRIDLSRLRSGKER